MNLSVLRPSWPSSTRQHRKGFMLALPRFTAQTISVSPRVSQRSVLMLLS
jgi:hypothetical protein